MLKKEKYERLKALGMNFGGPKQEKKPWHEQYKALAGKLFSETGLELMSFLSLLLTDFNLDNRFSQ